MEEQSTSLRSFLDRDQGKTVAIYIYIIHIHTLLYFFTLPTAKFYRETKKKIQDKFWDDEKSIVVFREVFLYNLVKN